MIAIVEKGPDVFYGQCKKCGSKFVYELEDITKGVYNEGVRCPICDTFFEHPKQNSNQNYQIPYTAEQDAILKSTDINGIFYQ